jgi:hypothetical protein
MSSLIVANFDSSVRGFAWNTTINFLTDILDNVQLPIFFLGHNISEAGLILSGDNLK